MTTPPPNMRLETVVSWLPDPRGWGMFSAITGRTRRDLQQDRVVIDAGSSTYGGWAQSTQRFTGLAGLVAGSQRAITAASNQLVNERSNLNPTAMNAFYERMQRGQA
jgi:hypothetical protein